MAEIHPTAVVDGGAKIGDGVAVGPYCVVGPNAELAEGVSLVSHVVVDGHSYIGPNTKVFPFVSIGAPPQDLKYAGEPTKLIIGANNIIREHCTLHPGTVGGRGQTIVGNNCLLMVNTHVAHDCIIGNHVVMANNATLGGHVEIGDYALLGGVSAVHQFVRVGRYAMIGGLSGSEFDVIPYGSVMGNRAGLSGLNLIGIKRRGFTRDQVHVLRTAYRLLFAEEGTLTERLADVAEMFGDHEAVMEIVDFIRRDSSRPICVPKPSAA